MRLQHLRRPAALLGASVCCGLRAVSSSQPAQSDYHARLQAWVEDRTNVSAKAAIMKKFEAGLRLADSVYGDLPRLSAPEFLATAGIEAQRREEQRRLDEEADIREAWATKGATALSPALLSELRTYAQLADLAYEQDDRDALKRELAAAGGFRLLSHTKESRPQQPSHFLAFNAEQKVACLAVRGTDNLEDELIAQHITA